MDYICLCRWIQQKWKKKEKGERVLLLFSGSTVRYGQIIKWTYGTVLYSLYHAKQIAKDKIHFFCGYFLVTGLGGKSIMPPCTVLSFFKINKMRSLQRGSTDTEERIFFFLEMMMMMMMMKPTCIFFLNNFSFRNTPEKKNLVSKKKALW